MLPILGLSNKEMQVQRKIFRKALNNSAIIRRAFNNSDITKAVTEIIASVMEHLLCVPGTLYIFFKGVYH